MSKYVGFRLGKVHESHVISEYYCGGCGYPVTDHDSFCPECGGAFRESDASDLEADNAALRELARNLYAEWRFAHARMRYIFLQHEERMRGIEQRMRELGITGVD